jgi:hypothetical protein
MGWSVVAGSGPFGGPTVTGAPYSAEEVTERVQTLADGTHVTQPAVKVKMYRDSVGRTRTERSMAGLPGQPEFPAMIMITDPVAHVMYRLSQSDKVAYKQVIPTPESQPAFRPSTAVAHDGPPPRRPPEIPDAERPKHTEDTLGNDTIDGVPVQGSRQTTIWPAGSRGNDRPITEVHETWISPDLHLTMLSKNTDPIGGDSTTKLTGISRAEPDPSLFLPPADYTVVTQ